MGEIGTLYYLYTCSTFSRFPSRLSFFRLCFISVTWNKKLGGKETKSYSRLFDASEKCWDFGCGSRWGMQFFAKTIKRIFLCHPSEGEKMVKKSWYSYIIITTVARRDSYFVCVIPGGIYTLDISPVQCRYAIGLYSCNCVEFMEVKAVDLYIFVLVVMAIFNRCNAVWKETDRLNVCGKNNSRRIFLKVNRDIRRSK